MFIYSLYFLCLKCVPLKSKGGACLAISEVFQEVGVKTGLHAYNARE